MHGYILHDEYFSDVTCQSRVELGSRRLAKEGHSREGHKAQHSTSLEHSGMRRGYRGFCSSDSKQRPSAQPYEAGRMDLDHILQRREAEQEEVVGWGKVL